MTKYDDYNEGSHSGLRLAQWPQLGTTQRHNWNPALEHAGIGVRDLGFDMRNRHNEEPQWRRDTPGVIIMLDGEGYFRSALTPAQTLQPGDGVLISPGSWVNYGPPPGAQWWELFCFAGGPVIDGILSTQPLINRPIILPGLADDKMVTYFSKALNATECPDYTELTQHIYAIFSHAITQLQMQPPQAPRSEHETKILELAQSIADHPLADWPLPHLAQSMGMTYDGFRKAFKRIMHLAPQTFIDHQRFHYACQLLHDGQQVKRVAEQCRFGDVFHFSRRFKKWCGVSPRTYQQQRR